MGVERVTLDIERLIRDRKTMKKTAIQLTKQDIINISNALRSGSRPGFKGPMSEVPSLDKIIIEESPPSDAPNAMAYVTTEGDDIHIVLSGINREVNKRFDQMKSQRADRYGNIDFHGITFSKLQEEEIKDEIKKEIMDNIYEIMAEAFAHESTHLKDFKQTGKLRSESEAEQGGRSAVEKIRASHVNNELKKLASKLDELGEDSFVKDVYRIASMLPKEELAPKAKLSQKDLDVLTKDLTKLFSK